MALKAAWVQRFMSDDNPHRLVFIKELYENNVIYVKDLLNKNNKFMCYNEFKEKY